MSRILADERGAVSTFLAVIALALLMAGGLAIDGGRKVNALREASHIADNAARAGAQAVDLDTLRTTGDLQLLPSEAANRVEAYLAILGYSATNVIVNGATVTVTVDITVDPVLLPTGPMTVSATETAAAITQEP
ncbi:MAG: pilus assembly protein TadG-related protein [Acidimicrobiia bacterium]|jgi:Flp pilus assembly protein TadG|nr:pilus assembly protein TadG-related protein [Acidimicrobiia bacterium]